MDIYPNQKTDLNINYPLRLIYPISIMISLDSIQTAIPHSLTRTPAKLFRAMMRCEAREIMTDLLPFLESLSAPRRVALSLDKNRINTNFYSL
jgi:hypothetical protein